MNTSTNKRKSLLATMVGLMAAGGLSTAAGVIKYLFTGLVGHWIAVQQLGDGLMFVLMGVGAYSVAELCLVHGAVRLCW